MKKIAVLLIILLLQALPKTYYVAPHGSDTNEGTEDQPFRTIMHALSVTASGDMIIVEKGVYTEDILVTVSGITLKGDAVIEGGITLAKNSNNIQIQGFTIRDAIWGISLEGNTTVYIEDVEVYNCEVGIHLTVDTAYPVSDVTITSCHLHDNQYVGIDGTPGPVKNTLISRCICNNNGETEGFGADGIGIEIGDAITIEDCTVYSNKGDGIDLCSRNHTPAVTTVKRCIVYSNAKNGIKLWAGGTVENSLVYLNGLAAVVFVHDGEYNLINNTIVKNTVEERDWAVVIGYEEEGNQDNIVATFFNNIIAFNGPESAPVGIYIGEDVTFTEDYNLWYSREDGEIFDGYWYTREDLKGKWLTTGNGSHSITEDPLFVDFSNNDFHLERGSPTIDAGTCIVTHDLELTERKVCDMGAYEYNEAVLSPTPDSLIETPVSETPLPVVSDFPSPAVSDSPLPVEGSSFSSSHPAKTDQKSTGYVLIILLVILIIFLAQYLRKRR